MNVYVILQVGKTVGIRGALEPVYQIARETETSTTRFPVYVVIEGEGNDPKDLGTVRDRLEALRRPKKREESR